MKQFLKSGFAALVLLLSISCKKDTPAPHLPEVGTVNTTEITSTTAIIEGYILYDGGAKITERGICYSTATNPTTSSIKVVSTSGSSPFRVKMTGLTPATMYYVRAYAINSVGTAYGNQLSIFTFN